MTTCTFIEKMKGHCFPQVNDSKHLWIFFSIFFSSETLNLSVRIQHFFISWLRSVKRATLKFWGFQMNWSMWRTLAKVRLSACVVCLKTFPVTDQFANTTIDIFTVLLPQHILKWSGICNHLDINVFYSLTSLKYPRWCMFL